MTDRNRHRTPRDDVPAEPTGVPKGSSSGVLPDQLRHRHERSHAQQLLRPEGELLPRPGIVAATYLPHPRSIVILFNIRCKD